MNRFFIFLVLSMSVVLSTATKFSDCGSTSGKVSSVEVSNCPDGQDVCILKRGTQVSIKIVFGAKSDSKSLKAVVHGVISSVPLPFPLPKSDACQTGVTCPVKNGENYTYDNSLNIRNSYPPVNVIVRWELKDENSADMVCVDIPSKLE